jgi:hypothetical protein
LSDITTLKISNGGLNDEIVEFILKIDSSRLIGDVKNLISKHMKIGQKFELKSAIRQIQYDESKSLYDCGLSPNARLHIFKV